MDTTTGVLVAYATAGGSTQGIAERIAEILRNAGLTVVCRPVGPDLEPAAFDAVVLGSAVHGMAWLRPAVDFLSRLPAGDAPALWCFSVGGLSHPERTRFSRWLAGSELQRIEQGFPGSRRPRDHRMFAGIVDLGSVPIWGRLFFRAAGGRSGDQRDWPAIEAWATEIANRARGFHRSPTEGPPGSHHPSGVRGLASS